MKDSDVIFVPHARSVVTGMDHLGCPHARVRSGRPRCWPASATAWSTRPFLPALPGHAALPRTVPFSTSSTFKCFKAVARSLCAQGFGRVFLICYTIEDSAG